jgi:hypothetical protein
MLSCRASHCPDAAPITAGSCSTPYAFTTTYQHKCTPAFYLGTFLHPCQHSRTNPIPQTSPCFDVADVSAIDLP